jgi:hypothetical protein
VATDGVDLEGSVLTAFDGYADNQLTVYGVDDMPTPAIVPGFATVNAPEPGAALLAAVALAALVGLKQSRRRRSAQL